MRILGIDPGSGATGYGLIDTDGTRHSVVLFGAIRTQSRRPFHERLHKIHRDLIDILSHEKADIMAVEDIFHAVNVQSALRLGHARGVALLAAAQFGLEVFEYSPLEIKSAVVGYGRAEKGQIQAMVRMLLGLAEIPSPDHAADALAVAICHAHRLKQVAPPTRRRNEKGKTMRWRQVC
ncbi:MAG TPA: crossover junction endodeoxyribonuclease RuvC [Acidobacteriota bacterium]|nr:crossover junction endodeoxyribonuclease RuvC [Acidobacteriota bacterium]